MSRKKAILSRPAADEPADTPGASFGDTLRGLARLTGAAIGLVLIVVAACYAVTLAEGLIRTANNPGEAGGMIDAWHDAIGRDTLRLSVAGQAEVDASRVVAISAIGGLLLLSCWLLISLIRVGAEVVNITTSDKRAIQRVLRAAFDKAAR